MLTKARNRIESAKFVLAPLETKEDFNCTCSFDCGKDDLNEYFREDALDHKEQLLAETYYFQPKEATEESLFYPVAFVSFLNDHIPLDESERKTIKKFFWKYLEKNVPHKLRGYPSFPAVKIGRLGVLSKYQRQGIGTYLMNITKAFFLTHNRTGCRFLTVDADNDVLTTRFYEKNGFQFLWDQDKGEDTRIMFFDLKRYEDNPPIIQSRED